MLAAGDERAATCGQTFHVRLPFGVGFHWDRATLDPNRQCVVCRRHMWGTYFLRCANGPGVCLRHTSLPEAMPARLEGFVGQSAERADKHSAVGSVATSSVGCVHE